MEPTLNAGTAYEQAGDAPPRRKPSGSTRILWPMLALVLSCGIAAFLLLWPQPAPTPVPAVAEPQSTPAQQGPDHAATAPQPVFADAAQPALAPEQGPEALREALTRLLGQRALAELFYPEHMIHRIVATVDNLPRRKAPLTVMPVRPARESFETSQAEGARVIAARNARRYAPYAALARSLDARAAAALYLRFYPLFQREYEQLGFPGRDFNDRLLEVIDDLLAAPEPARPVQLARPKVFYEFADPELESLSAGQKIMIRIGSANAAAIKAKLLEIRREVARAAPRTQ